MDPAAGTGSGGVGAGAGKTAAAAPPAARRAMKWKSLRRIWAQALVVWGCAAAALAFFSINSASPTAFFELAPPGSVASCRARLAVWLLTSTFLASYTWKASTVVSRGMAILFWVVDAATQLVIFHDYVMFVRAQR